MAKSEDTAKRPPGIACPVCTARLRTTETRRRSDGTVRRVKTCPQCGRVVQTVERPITAR